MTINSEIRVFISHSSMDEEAANVISELLKAALNLSPKNIRCSSIDGYRFSGGTNIDENIRDDVLKADVLIGLISPASCDSAYVLFELGVRWGSGKCLKPVLLPNTNTNELKGPLSGLNALQCGEPGQIHQLIEEIGEELKISPEAANYYQVYLEKLCSYSISETVNECAFTFSDGGHVLAVGAHWDDVLLGCLGTLIKLRTVYDYKVDIVVLCNSYPYGYFGVDQSINLISESILKTICEEEGFTDLTPKLADWIGNYNLQDRNFREQQTTLTSMLQNIKSHSDKSYNLILSPPSGDRNPDHALTAEAAFSVFRNPENLVLEYDIKRYTENPFVPSICIGLDDEYELQNGKVATIADRKIYLLYNRCKISKKSENLNGGGCVENSEHLFSKEALKARMYVNAQDNGKNKRVKYAEIFHGRIEL